jgi:hypothetical protein
LSIGLLLLEIVDCEKLRIIEKLMTHNDYNDSSSSNKLL